MTRFIMILLLLLFFTACGKNEPPAEPVTQAEPLGLADVSAEQIVEDEPLPPLETGLVELRDDVFGEIIELKGKSRPINEVFLIKETEMLIKDGYLLQKNLPDYDSRFRALNVFKLPELKLVASFGRRGQGPGEFLYPSLVSTDDPDILCYMFENTLKMLYSLDRNLRLREVPFDRSLQGTGMMETQMHVFNPQDIVYLTTYEKSMGIHRLRLEGESEVIDKKIYDLSFSPKYKVYTAFRGAFAASQKKQRLVFAYGRFKRIVFMDPTGSEVRTVFFKRPEPPAGNAAEMQSPENVAHYWRVSAGDEFIYLTYSGQTTLQSYNDNKKGKGSIFVEQWDWNGNPVRKFKLDDSGIFCVDEKNCKLFLLAPDYDDPFLVYDLPPLTDKTLK